MIFHADQPAQEQSEMAEQDNQASRPKITPSSHAMLTMGWHNDGNENSAADLNQQSKLLKPSRSNWPIKLADQTGTTSSA